MRLTVQVRDPAGKVDDGATTQLIAMLRVLGGEPPSGLEVPVGPDVDVLNGKTISDVKTGWIAAAVTAAQALLGVTPWRVVVDLRDNGNAHAVTTRNGRSAGSALIDATPLGADEPQVQPIVSAAAFVLVCLHRGYTSGFEGLGGARDWRSVSWQFAAEALEPGKADRVALLTRAVDVDPMYLPAQMALRYELNHRSNDDRSQQMYGDWLAAMARTVDASANPYLRIRLLHSASAVMLNRLQSRDAWGKSGFGTSVAAARELTNDLVIEVRALPLGDPFRLEIEPIGRVLYALARQREVPDTVTQALGSTSLDYDLACHYASRKEVPMALDRLAAVMTDPGGREEVLNDPYLRDLAATPAFRARYPGARKTDWLALGLVEEHAAKLRAAGISSPALLIAAANHRPGFTSYIGGSLIRDLLVGLAELALAVPSRLASVRLDIVEVLAGEGVFRLGDIPSTGGTDLASLVAAALDEKSLTLNVLARKDLDAWLSPRV